MGPWRAHTHGPAWTSSCPATRCAALVEVLAGIRTGRPSRAALESGHYANVLKIDDQRGLALSCDSVGSKVIVCEQLGRYDTIGIDLWGMNANDVICVGADPIALLDYIAVEEAEPGGARADRARACARAPSRPAPRSRAASSPCCPDAGPRPPVAARLRPGRVLRGPGRPRLRSSPATAIEPGDTIVGIPSSGIHSNGLSLARGGAHGPRRGARPAARRWATCCSSRP